MARRPLTVEDLWSCSRVGAPVAPTDGSFAVVPVTTYDMETNESEARLYRVKPGSDPVALTASGTKSTGPALSPDGRRLAFVRPDEDKNGQIAVMPLDGGEAEVLTKLPLGASDPKWFPCGTKIGFLAEVFAEAPDVEATRELAKERKDSKVKAYVSENVFARFWDHWVTEGKVVHIFVLDLATGTVTDVIPESRRLFDLDGADGSWDISPDGKEIAFSADRSDPPHRQCNWDVFTVDLKSGAVTNRTQDNPGHEWTPRYSPDGKYLLYGRQEIPEFYADRVRLTILDRAAGTETVLTEGWDRSAGSCAWSPDSGSIVLIAEDRGCHALFRMGLKPGTPEEIHRGGTLGGLLPLADGSVLLNWDDANTPAELFRMDAAGTLDAWTDINAPLREQWDLGEVIEHMVDLPDGSQVQYREVLPANFDPGKKYPLILAVHGGPHGMWGDNFHYRWNMQLFAAKGHVVIAPNPHGSTSWGQEFADCIQGDWGDTPHRDCMAVMDHVIARGYVDEKRMTAAGGSYGGYMMAWFAGHTDRFAAIINHAGCSNTMSMWSSDFVEDWGRSMGANPWESNESCDKQNPIRFSSGFKTPMLVIHGELDYRVPVTQGLEIYHMYKAKGVPARLLVFPDENHWILKPQNSRLWWTEFFAWVERWTG